MIKEDLIESAIFCQYHHIEPSFVDLMEESGLVEFIVINEQKFIHHSQLQQVERIIRLHQELEINISGVEAIVHLLERVEQMQFEISSLKNRLSFYV